MKDKLKDSYISSTFHSSSNSLQPSDQLWNQISKGLDHNNTGAGENTLPVKKKGKSSKKWVASISAAVLLLFGITVYAVQGWQLFDGEGNVLLTLEELTDPSPRANEFTSLDELRETLEPGQALAVYFKDNNPKNIVSTIMEPISYTSIEEIRDIFSTTLKFPEYVPEHYAFEKGTVSFRTNHTPEIHQEVIHEGSISPQGVGVKEVELNLDEPFSTHLYFTHSETGEQIIFNVSPGPYQEPEQRIRYYQHLDQKDIIMTKVNEADAFLFNEESSRYLLWMEYTEEESFDYQITVPASASIDHEELIRMAESITE